MFLAISTGFGEVVRIAIINIPVTNGYHGLPSIPRSPLGGTSTGLLPFCCCSPSPSPSVVRATLSRRLRRMRRRRG
ncbi:MAG: hypothetical protein U0531_08220 [Dehalococcoidia bacterium]